MTNGTGKPKHLQEFVMTAKGRDFELCSGGEEDEYLEVEVHSPTDSSEDSVEVKVSPICLRNKRKCAEPRKVQDAFTAPLKKRMCLKAKNEISANGTDGREPFRPWSAEHHRPASPSKANVSKELRVPFTSTSIPTDLTIAPESSFAVPQPPLLLQSSDFRHQVPTHSPMYVRPPSPSSPFECKPIVRSPSPTQPLPLVKKNGVSVTTRERKTKIEPNPIKIKTECDVNSTASCDPLSLRVPLHPQLGTLTPTEAERLLVNSAEAFPNLHSSNSSLDDHGGCGRKEQRNYKNMTRERRIEANARERTRVHTISAAFETLRRSVPAYSHNQKLSKLSVLRIACSYIMTLSTLVGGAAGLEANPSTSLAECIDTVSKTIQKEGKLRKKKDDVE